MNKIGFKKLKEDKEIELETKSVSFCGHKVTKEAYESNYKFLMKTDRFDAKSLCVGEGRFKKRAKRALFLRRKERFEVTSLVKQTYRQAWGELVCAQHGVATSLHEALYKVNALRAHLLKICPECVEGESEKKLLTVLSNSYLNSANVKEALVEQEKVAFERLLNIKKILDTNLKCFSLGKNQGLTESLLIKADKKNVAIQKSLEERAWAGYMAVNELGLTREAIPLFSHFSGLNETLATTLDMLLGGRLRISLSISTEEATIHAYAENEGSLRDCAVRGKYTADFFKRNEVAAQRFIFTQLILRNADCHSQNILLSDDREPIPIDFGRILASKRPIRGAYFEFPCLDKSISYQDRKFFQNLDVEKTVHQLEGIVKSQYEKELASLEALRGFKKGLEVLRARLYMIQIGMKEGLNQRELIALDLPPLCGILRHQCEQAMNHYFTRKLTRKEFKNSQQGIQAIEYMDKNGFQRAWKAAYQPEKNQIDEVIFQKTLRAEIKKLSGFDKDELYGPVEKFVYFMLGYDALALDFSAKFKNKMFNEDAMLEVDLEGSGDENS